MSVDIKVPSVGESVQEAVLAEWFKNDGDPVERDEPLFVIETDKVTLEVVAEAAGILSIKVAAGETVAIGEVVGTIDTESGAAEAAPEKKPSEPAREASEEKIETGEDQGRPEPVDSTKPVAAKRESDRFIAPPSVRRLASEKNVDLSRIEGTGPGGRITKLDVILHLECAPSGVCDEGTGTEQVKADSDGIRRKTMSPIRRRIAERLLEARRNTAMLTTFNEIDMGRAMEIRKEYKEAFQKKFDVSLGFMSFFIRACVEALQEFPEINAFIDGDEIVYHDYQHIGVAVGSERGLVVPVIRHAERLGFAALERAIVEYVKKIRENRLEIADLEGGTFTISNGGVYGSLLSTPILNTPQSGILGMHKIEKRPVVIGDAIEIRPMMYVALSYDHRIVDGREAVQFLKRVKEFIENPERMLLEI
jgi:2-oxoglutarate dehydrogenase E2 component (dihydrolipoamide succinyltransferase)